MGTIQIDGSTPKLTIGNATAEDASIVYDGNAKDFYIALDDSADKLVIGEGSTVGTNSILTITDDSVTIGDAAAVDTKIVFDGNAQDFYVGLDDSADDLVIGLGSTVGTTPAISINSDRDVTISDGAIDFDVASHDTSNGLKLGGTLVTATAAELNIMDGVTSTAAEINLIDGGTARGTTAIADGDGVLINDAGTMRMTSVETLATYIGGGITEADSWRVNAVIDMSTGAYTDLTSSWERTDSRGFATQLGTGLSQSSGIFSLPSTGYYLISWHFNFYADAGASNTSIQLSCTLDNSSYLETAATSANVASGESIVLSGSYIFDVTNTTNCKFKWRYYSAGSTNNILGHTDETKCGFTCVRLGDT
jgi:hypothetical protein